MSFPDPPFPWPSNPSQTLGRLIDRVKGATLGGHRPAINLINSNISAGAPTMQMEFGLEAIAVGAKLCIGREIFFVTATDRGTRTVSVIGGMLGSEPSDHGYHSLVDVNLRWDRTDIADALLAEIRSWPPELNRLATVNLAYNSAQRGYDLVGVQPDIVEVLGCFRAPESGVSNASWPSIPFRFEREMDTAAFASGMAIFVEYPHTTGVPLRVVYSRPYDLTNWEFDTTDLLELGLTHALFDVLFYGALWRLASTGETARSDPSARSESQDLQGLPAMLNTNNARALQVIRDRRISDEVQRVQRMWHLRGW